MYVLLNRSIEFFRIHIQFKSHFSVAGVTVTLNPGFGHQIDIPVIDVNNLERGRGSLSI